MNDPAPAAGPPPARDELMSALFAQLVVQQTDMAFIFLGKAPNPQTGETKVDLEHARYFIDQLEMLEAKTRGNLTREESALLKQGLTATRLAFVEASGRGESPAPKTAEEGAETSESRKKFSKKY